ncbi:MAG: hypothetical protein LBP51_05675 [Deferribacteraceae bacterium]|jgi:hypothetical protein|nr:hypothetical protein [Deferribacteraceae bacterium]
MLIKNLAIIAFLFLFSGFIACTAGDSPFEGSWESISGTIRYKFYGSSYEAFSALEDDNGKHYYKGKFTYKEMFADRGVIRFKQTHSAAAKGAWKVDAADAAANYKIMSTNAIEISSTIYRKKVSFW